MEDSNNEIVSYFSKFEKNKNYDMYQKRFEDLTKFKLHGMIQLGELEIPDVGPDPELSGFHETLEGWSEQDVTEVKNIIKLYDTGEIESLEEAILLIQILRNKDDNYPKILDDILNDFQTGQLKNLCDYSKLLEFKRDDSDSIIYGGLWTFLVSLTE